MSNRDPFTLELRPAAGSRFQPTGFPDLGPGVFQRPVGEDGWQDCLLVESAQSMANHLESTAWDRGNSAPVPAFGAMPYVRVVDGDGGFLASSRTESHRLASSYVKAALHGGRPMIDVIKERLGLRDETPLAPREIAAAIFRLDPMCLVHGVFFSDKGWPGNPKVARALTSFVEAHDVRPAISGGVKRDDVSHETADRENAAKEGYGFVPFHRAEYVARRIEASFCLDVDQIRAYGLPSEATDLLVAAARFEIRSLLDRGLRLRTACDLVPIDPGRVDDHLAPLAELTSDVERLSAACSGLWDDPTVLEVVWTAKKAKKAAAVS